MIKNHFEIPVDNPTRATKFYKEVFGWKIEKWGKQEYWVINPTAEGGMDGGLMNRADMFLKGGNNSYVVTFEVDDLEKIADKIKEAGGEWVNEGGLIHGVGFHQYFKDTEGNIFGALQPDRTAKDVPQ